MVLDQFLLVAKCCNQDASNTHMSKMLTPVMSKSAWGHWGSVFSPLVDFAKRQLTSDSDMEAFGPGTGHRAATEMCGCDLPLSLRQHRCWLTE